MARIPASTRTRVAKAAFGGITVVGICSAAEVEAKGAAATPADGDNSMKLALLSGAALVFAAGVGYFLLQEPDDPKKNIAFVFIKPHAYTDATKSLVRAELEKRNISIRTEGVISGSVIDERKYIDQHYYAIASKATLLEPKDLPVPADKFQANFGISWTDALAQGKVYNAMQACSKLNCTPDDLDKKWGAAKKRGKAPKFGGGFYCAEIDGIYVFNGFFMSMRAKFTGDAKIHYYVAEWNSDDLKWAEFRGKVLGPTDPAEAPADSIRGLVAAQWKQLGLAKPCNMGDNAVHASASPFEALSEITNWMEGPIPSESFGRQMIQAGISPKTIQKWSRDPQVNFTRDGKEGKFSLFDLVEDMDSAECLRTLVDISKFCGCNN